MDDHTGENPPRPRIRPDDDSLIVYSIKDHELDCLSGGSLSDFYLNTCIMLLTLGFSCLISAIFASHSDRGFIVVVTFTSVSFVVGGFCFVSWGLSKKHKRDLIDRIKHL